MNLRDAFNLIGVPDGLSYMDEDTVGGWHEDGSQSNWPMGSMWAVEGQFLYGLVRAIRPNIMIEVGTWVGCSATHILSAMAANNKGILISVDIDLNAGSQIPAYLRKRWKLIVGRGQDAIEHLPTPDILFEDASHEFEDTAEILSVAKDKAPRLILSHDGGHFLVGSTIRAAHESIFGQAPTFLIDPAGCGFTYQVLHD